MTVIGQDELRGALKLNVSFDTELEWNGAYPELLYWDYGEIYVPIAIATVYIVRANDGSARSNR